MAYTEKDIAKRRQELQRGGKKFDSFAYQGPNNAAPTRTGTGAASTSGSSSSRSSGSRTGSAAGPYTEDMIKKRREERTRGRQDTFAYQAPDFSVLPTPKINPFRNVTYQNPAMQAAHQQTGWMDPTTKALWDIANQSIGKQSGVSPSTLHAVGGLQFDVQNNRDMLNSMAQSQDRQLREQDRSRRQQEAFDNARERQRQQGVANERPDWLGGQSVGEYMHEYMNDPNLNRSYDAETVRRYNEIYDTQGPAAAQQYVMSQNSEENTNMERIDAALLGVAGGSGISSLAGVVGGQNAYRQIAGETQRLQEAHPIASTAGNIAGAIPLITGIGNVIRAIPGFAGMSNVAKAVVSGAAAMGAGTAVQEAGAFASGMRSGGDYARDIITSGLAGGAGGAAGNVIGQAGTSFLRNNGLMQNRLAQTVVAGLTGSAYSAAGTGVRELDAFLRDPENYRLDGQKAFKDAAVAFAFGAISYNVRGQNFTMNEEDPNKRPSSKWFEDCSTPQEVDAKLRQYARQYHPDQATGNADLFAEISAEATAQKAWMNVNAGAQAYQRAQEASSAGNAAEYQAAKAEYDSVVNALVADVQSGAIQGQEAVEAVQILQSVSANLAEPAAGAPDTAAALAEIANMPFDAVSASASSSTPALSTDINAGIDSPAVATSQQNIPGNPYAPRTARQQLEQAANQLVAANQAAQREAQLDQQIAETTAAMQAVQREAAETNRQEIAHVKDQIRAHADDLGSMNPVSTVSTRLEIGGLNRSEKTNSIAKLFSDAGNKIPVDGVGDVIIDKKRINNSLRYITTDLEYQAYQAIPEVLQNGVVINEHGDHKGREYSTVTIAAPVQFDPPAVETPTRGNVAVVVKKTNDNYYKVHRVLTDQQMGSGQNKKQALHPSGAALPEAQSIGPVQNSSEYAGPEGNASSLRPTELSNYSISDSEGLSNSRLSREVIDYGTGESGADLSDEGSGRAVSLRTGERDGEVSSGAGVSQTAPGNLTAKAADTEAGNLRIGGAVKATEILPTAEKGQVIHRIESGHTPSIRKADAMAKAYDQHLETIPFVSEGDIRTEAGESSRAFINPETRQIGYRANDERATGDKLMMHELIECGIIDGKISIKDTINHLRKTYAGTGYDIDAAVNAIAKYYAGDASEEILAKGIKELFCDAGAGINQFEGVDGFEDEAFIVEDLIDTLHPYMNEKLGGAFDAEAEDVPVATMEGVTPEQAKALETVNTAIDTESGSANALPIEYSADLWNESQYVKERTKAVEAIRENLKVSKKKAEKYIDDINSVAKMIIADRGRYDYKNSGLSPFVSNAEYGGSFDFDTLCPKRGPFIGTFQAIQEQLPNTALTRDEVLAIRKMMDDNGLEVPCGKCYVEGSRAAMGEFTKKFLELYKKYYPENWQPNMAQANTPDGIEWIRLTHPECYEQYEYFWNHYGTLKPGDPNLFASQQKPKLYMSHSAYSNEILREFKNKLTVIEKNRNGGIRFQSFSDCEIIHIIDAMQAIMDMSVVGLNGQGYTKQPNFAAAFGDTGLKINLSIDAWGFDEDGKLIFNSKEGMPFETAMELRNKHSKNVGTICCVYDDKMLLAALADDRIDFIIPFHRSQWKKSQYKAMGLPSTTKDYTYQQNEKWLDPSRHTHEYRGRQVKTKCLNYMPNDYWDFSKSGKENAEKYLDMCYRDGKRPKFYKFLDKTMVEGKAKFSLKKDGSTDGYWKLLIDFKMYDNDGVGSPQMPVRPNFDMQEIQRMFDEYAGDHHSYPVAKGIVDQFVSDYKKKHPGIQYSSKLNLSGKQGASGKQDSSGNELTVQQEEYFKDSKIRDEDGNLLVVYHGTSEDFTVFDKSKGRSNMDIQGSFFSPWDIDAEGYGPNVKTVYLNIKNPAPERIAYKALNMFKGQNGAGIKAREYLISRGYDGVNNGDEEYIAFYPEQIKNIDNLAPTENEDIRYSTKLNLQGKEIELTEREEKIVEQLSDSYLTRIEQVTAQKDAQIAELKEKMKAAVGAEKEKARQRIEKLRQEKNNRIAYLEKQWRKNTDWRIAELKRKAEAKRGEEHDDMIRRLAKLQAQKDQKIEEILAEHRRQRQEARDRRNDRKLRVKFQKMARKALRDAQTKPGLASERVQELLKDIDLTALGMRDDTRTSLHNKLLEIMEMRKTDENYLALHAEEDWKKVERLFKKQIKDMSLEEVSDMITELSALIHYQETTDKLIRDEQNRSAAEVGRQIVSDLKELTPLDVTNPVKVLSAKFIRDNLSPERAFNRLSGYKRDSAMKTLYRQVLDGYTKVKSFEKMSAELFEGFEKDEKNKDFLQNAAKQTIPVTGKYGQTAMISPAMRVSLYMASKNRDNQRHIATDGMTVPEPKAYAKGLIDDAYGRGTTIILEPTEIDKICAGMTESEKEFARLLETFFDGYAKEAINETSVDLDGVLKAIVDNYFPISSDKNFLAKSMDSFQDPTLEGWNNLKKRQEGANNKILLEDARQVLNRHIRNTARYYGLAIPLRNWNKVYGYTSHRDEFTGTRNSVQSAIKNAWNSDTAEYIERLIRDDINAGGRRAERGVMDKVRGSYAGSTLTLNAGVALKQTTSYFMAGSILDMKSLMYGLSHKFTKADQEYMDSITPWGWARRQGESTIELGEMARRKDPITKNTPNWNQAMDVITTNALFTATEHSIRKDYPGLKRGDTKYDEALAERYNQVLWRTQPQYEAAFRPEYLRKTDIGSRTFGMFKTESMQMSGELIDAWGQWRADEKRARSGSEQAKRQRGESAKQFYKTFASWIASNMSFAMMGTALDILLFHKGRPYRNDRGEIDWQTIATKTGMNFISSSLGGFMFASTAFDFGSYLYNIISGNKATWYDIEVPGISLINDMVTNTGDWVGTLLDEEATPAMKARATSKFALAASKFTPLGFSENLLKLADSVNLYVQDIREGIKTGDWHLYEAGDGFLQDTSPTKDQYAHQAVYYAGQGNVERAGRALKRTKKTNLEKALGRKVGDTMFARFVENPQDLVSYMKTVASDGSSRAPKISDVPEHGFSSFTKLKEGLGSPNRNENWHHIVEQEQGPGDRNFGTFSATQINNANNVVSIPSGAGSVHKAITDYYGSVQDFTDGMTVREWLAETKDFEEQFDFGIEQLRKYGDVAPTERGWVFIPNEEKIDKIPLKEGKAKELTASQKRWDTKIAEAREDGGLTDREIHAAALEMLDEGTPKDEVVELYKSKKKDKYIDEWMSYDGDMGGDLGVYFGFMDAKALGNQDGAAEYLNDSNLSEDDKWALWQLVNWSESSYDKKVE